VTRVRAAWVIAALFGWVGPAAAADPAEEFTRGTKIFSFQVGGGDQNNLEGHNRISNISFINVTPRLSVLPLDSIGNGFSKGAVETGLEPWFQYYLEPATATAEGLKVALRYHFLSASPIFPYLEVTAGAAATSLNVKEIRSNFTIVLEAGIGLSYFVTEGVALTAGYRFQHISNGNVESPNRGFNSDTGTLGISFFFH
jgi:hypothetical protein